MGNLEEAVERVSQAMLDNCETKETQLPGGLISSETLVRVKYIDLVVILAACDKALKAHSNHETGHD